MNRRVLVYTGIVLTLAVTLHFWRGQSQVPSAMEGLGKFFDAIEFPREPSRWRSFLSQGMAAKLSNSNWDEGQVLRSYFAMNWSDRSRVTGWSRVQGRFRILSGKIEIEYARDNMGPFIVTMVKEGNQWVIEGEPTHINEFE